MDILNLCITPNSFKNMIACIIVDLQKPWSIMDELTSWMRALINLTTENTVKLSKET